MTWIEAGLWGLFGGFAVEGLDLYSAVCRRGCWPWRAHGPRDVGAAGYFVGELVRLLIGGGLAWAAAASQQISTPFGALFVGIAAPLIVERLTRSIPLTGAELEGQRISAEEQRAYVGETKKVASENDQPDVGGE